MSPASLRAHPVDSAGLVLPAPSWPDEDGSAGPLEPVRRFCNTTNRENGADAWRTSAELAAWLASEGYGGVTAVDAASLARLRAVREALWAGIATGEFGPLARAAGPLGVRLDGVALVPDRRGIDAVVTRLVLAVVAGASAGTLGRLKSCDHCRWVFHDTSKNRRGRWCSMEACGGREKARAYRTRRNAGPPSGRPRP
jgi:hypothetical protein